MQSKKPVSISSGNVFYAWGMSLPALMGLMVFVILPLVLGISWSFTNKRLISPLPTEFIGLQNYDRLLAVHILKLEPEIDPSNDQVAVNADGDISYPRVRTIIKSNPELEEYREWFDFDWNGRKIAVLAKDPTFIRAIINTIIFVLVIVPFQGGLALCMALLVNQKLRGITVFRAAFFSPVVTSMAVIAVVWTFFYNPDIGLVNQVITKLSFGTIPPSKWLFDPKTALLAIIIVSAWQAAGFQMVIFLAGLQEIPDQLYEAAKIDGANGWQIFRQITIPQLRNTIIFVVISTTILAFRLFTQVDVMTRGGPQDSTATIIYHAVNMGFRQQQIGYGSAITVIFFVIVLVIALIQKSVLKTDRAME